MPMVQVWAHFGPTAYFSVDTVRIPVNSRWCCYLSSMCLEFRGLYACVPSHQAFRLLQPELVHITNGTLMYCSPSLHKGRSYIVGMARTVYSGSSLFKQRFMPPTRCCPSVLSSGPYGRTQYARALLRSPEPSLAPADKATAVDGVNESQRLAVQHHTGSCRVMAGPGSGKTRVRHKISSVDYVVVMLLCMSSGPPRQANSAFRNGNTRCPAVNSYSCLRSGSRSTCRCW